MKTAPFRREGRCCCIRRGAVVYWGGGAMWASPPTNGLSRVRLYNVSPSVALRATPPSQREAKISAPVGAWTGDGLPRQSADWLAMTAEKAGAGKRCVGAGFYPARLSLRRPTGDTSLTEGGKDFRACGRHLPHRGRQRISAPVGAAGGAEPLPYKTLLFLRFFFRRL